MFRYSEQIGKWVYLLLAITIVFAIGVSDYLTEQKISFYVFYALPIFIAAWFVGKWAGLLISVASSAAWFAVDLKDILYPGALAYIDAIVRLSFFMVISLVLSALRRSLDRERNLARTDFLTGLPNRRVFIESTRMEIERMKRNQQPCTVAYVDVDNFKPINDRYGHEVGDELLRVVARELRHITRAIDTIARIGGDEFVILYPETPSEKALLVLNKLYSALTNNPEARKLRITFSIGAVTYLIPLDSAEEMIRRADEVMYTAKESGKNAIRHQEITRVANVS